ncbi:hypothetical protein [Oceanicoccus sagamiensis]|uniref:Uncharacterized protein n=1 Tax=Oceanicoccus sagamiensis TaxID=716816 RepID=A0A1X9N9U3_9GAMM|nr:hypothetical protein [Oceanicoccus sagamiensis]ARN74848.1 hypothetical protein BST96_12415 [Oceanicoccus sagamiensis]
MNKGITIIAIIGLLLSSQLFAQDPNEMVERLEKAQACMNEVDRTEFKRIESALNALQTELKQLCDQGKPDQAQKKAQAFAQELKGSMVIEQVKECAEILEDMMPEMAVLNMPEDFGDIDICGQQ